MLLNKAIQIAKGDEAEKVGMSLKMAVTLKEDLQALANGNNVSLNALICSILDVAINSDEIIENSISNKGLISDLLELEERKAEISHFIEENGGLDMEIKHEASIAYELKGIDKTIETLKGMIV